MSLLSCLSAWADSFPLPLGPPPPPHHLPFLRLCCFFPFRVLLAGYRLGWANPLSLPPHQSPYLPLPSEHMLLFFRVRAFRPGPALPLCFYRSPFNDKAHTARLPHRTSTWVGLPLLPCCPAGTIPPLPSPTTNASTFAATHHPWTPSTPYPPQNLRRVYFGPRHHNRIACQLREKRRGR